MTERELKMQCSCVKTEQIEMINKISNKHVTKWTFEQWERSVYTDETILSFNNKTEKVCSKMWELRAFEKR